MSQFTDSSDLLFFVHLVIVHIFLQFVELIKQNRVFRFERLAINAWSCQKGILARLVESFYAHAHIFPVLRCQIAHLAASFLLYSFHKRFQVGARKRSHDIGALSTLLHTITHRRQVLQL